MARRFLYDAASTLVALKAQSLRGVTLASTTRGGGFARAGETEPGHKRSEVDRLFTRLAEDYEKAQRSTSSQKSLHLPTDCQVIFREPGGYKLDVVDRALEKIEERFAKPRA